VQVVLSQQVLLIMAIGFWQRFGRKETAFEEETVELIKEINQYSS
jgi:hypothetical protein